MKRYLLLLFTSDYNVLNNLKFLGSFNSFYETPNNVFIIFDSSLTKDQLSNNIHKEISNNIKFYFLFEVEDLVTCFIPKQVYDMFYNINGDCVKLQYQTEIDMILDKLQLSGDNLNENEKYILNNIE